LPAVVLLGPSLAFLAAFTYWPVMRVVAMSVMVGRFAGQTAVGFGNYQRLFADPGLWRSSLRSATISRVCCALKPE
jgi:sn-glycerol 3-phosphate transport system permease protein